MLDNAWLIPLVPAVSFFAILFVGKRLPRKGSEIGVLAVASSFVMACISVVPWIAGVGNNIRWSAFCDAGETQELAGDPRACAKRLLLRNTRFSQ